MAILKNSLVGCICVGRTCASSAGYKTARLGASAAGTGGQKTAVGYYASGYNSGAHNTAFGSVALSRNTGYNNTGIGTNTLKVGTSNNNTAVGTNSLCYLSTGNCNVAVGAYSLSNLSTGSKNVGVGKNAGITLTSGCYNTFVGYNADATSNGVCKSVAVGNCAKVGGSCSVAIGEGAYANGSNAIAIGTNSYATTDNIAWGNSQNNGCNMVWGSWSYTSDCRDKTDVLDIDDNLGINFIRKLKPVKFKSDSRDLYVKNCNFEYGTKDGTLKNENFSYGFIAQDIKDIADELQVNFDFLKYNKNKDAYKLSYSQLLASIVKTIKTIDERIEVLKTKI